MAWERVQILPSGAALMRLRDPIYRHPAYGLLPKDEHAIAVVAPASATLEALEAVVELMRADLPPDEEMRSLAESVQRTLRRQQAIRDVQEAEAELVQRYG